MLFCLQLAMLFSLSFPFRALRVVSLQSFSSLHLVRVDETLFFGVHPCTALCEAVAPPPCGRAPPTFCLVSKGFQADVSHVVIPIVHRGPCSAVEATWLIKPILSPLLRVARLRLLTPASCSRRCILLTRCLVVSGHLSTSSALLTDRSAEPVVFHTTYSCRAPQALSL